LPPNSSISLAAEWIVPGSFGLGSEVLASIATLQPSLAAHLTIANPMPLEPPVTTIVLFFRENLLLKSKDVLHC
jgi:hypothetical protein